MSLALLLSPSSILLLSKVDLEPSLPSGSLSLFLLVSEESAQGRSYALVDVVSEDGSLQLELRPSEPP